MGCGNTKSVPMINSIENNSDFQLMINTIQITWQNIKKIDNLGPKIFAK